MIHDAGWLKLRRERCQTNTNEIIDPYFIFEFHEWVMTIPVTTDGQLIMLEHYRHGLRQVGWEFPSGLSHPGEEALEGAARELREETGYVGKECRLLGRLAPNPALQSNFMSVVLISDAEKVAKPELEAGEELRVHLKSVEQVSQLIADGEMYHALNIAAFSLAKARHAFDEG